MKKSITAVLLTALALPVLTGCPSTPKETRTEEEIIQENADTALAQVGITYNKFAESAGLSKDTELTLTTNVDGYRYKFAYELTATYDYGTNNWVKLEQTDDGASLKVVVPEDTQLPSDNTSFAAYTLKGTVKFVGYAEDFVAPRGLKITEDYIGHDYGTKEWKIRVNSAKTIRASAAELYTNKALVSKKTRVITWGIYAGFEAQEDKFTASSNKLSLYFDDGNHSFIAYDAAWTEIPKDLVIGKVYKVTGLYENYYNSIEIKAPTFELDESHVCEPATMTKITTKEDLADITHASTRCEVTGTITKIVGGYSNEWKHGDNKMSVYVNISGTKDDSGKLVDEAYAYVHQFDTEASYKTWADNCTLAGGTWNQLTLVSGGCIGATITFNGRAYWYSGYPAFYVSTLTNYVAPTL